MKRLLNALLALCVLASCENGNDDNPTEFTTCVYFPEAPIEIMSNQDVSSNDYDCRVINYFNIVQAKENLYYLYYAALGKYSGDADIEQGLFFAYSNDAIHWKRELPDGRNNIIVPSGIQEQSVFKLESDNENPYRLVANIKEANKHKLCMWESKNGYDFDFSNRTVLLDDRLHDTQNVIIPRNDSLYLYTRLWSATAKDRRNAIARFNRDGVLDSSIDTLAGNYVYNSAASYVNEQYDLLLPTFINNKDGDSPSDEAYFKAFLKDVRADCVEIDTNLNQWLKDYEKWMIAAPGILNIDGEKYIAYYTWNRSHDGKWPEPGICKYYLIKMELYINGKKI